jgi:acyl transferase domain-containing protein
MSAHTGFEVAVIGMAGRFPKADGLDEFWRLLHDGEEAMTWLDDDTIVAHGVRREVVERENYVKCTGVLEGESLFDAEFFDINPREAEILDPQQRVFLECCFHALEDAGYRADNTLTGVYAGAGTNTYRISNLHANVAALRGVDPFQIKINSDRDFLSTRVCYKLKLLGPGLTVQTACSTSLVAVHLAVQGLLSGACDLALAGGVAIRTPQRVGFLYHPDHILSPDGHCRAFDARAQGTTGGNGVGVVVLERLQDALAHGSNIRAVIKGTAINNDGAMKVGYTAPSIEGQASVIRAAQLMAEVEPESISYVEAHGTGTPLGDPIEIAALTQAFGAGTERRQFCAVGSVKTNIGHLDAAAGVAGLIKTVLALEHRAIPPSLHFEAPNPKIDFAASPFFVCNQLREWSNGSSPRRAGVSSFGIGGTNAHVIVEEAPEPEPAAPAREVQLLVLSAKSAPALDAMTGRLVGHLRANPRLDLADVTFTLQVGRLPMAHRRALVCRTVDDAVQALGQRDGARLMSATAGDSERAVVFLFPGQGAQYAGMAGDLYREEPAFRAVVDRCSDLLRPQLGLDLREVVFAAPEAEANARLQQTALAQPALFVVEVALAALWREWGIKPQAMIGHSVGEYAAAYLSGVFTLEEGLALVAARGRLVQSLPAGAMLSVAMPEADLAPWLTGDLALAAVNAPALCTVSGPTGEIAELERQLGGRNVETQRLHTSHAFHSSMLDPILEAFAREVQRVDLRPPRVPYISNLTGTWIAVQQAIDPRYWVDQLRRTVRFADGVTELLRDSRRIYLEAGPGRTLATFLNQPGATRPPVLQSLRHPRDRQPDAELLVGSLARLWLEGAAVDWAGFHRHERRRRMPLPTYPFQRQRYWLEPAPRPALAGAVPGKRPRLQDWLYVPSWQRSPAPPPAAGPDHERRRWLLLGGGELQSELAKELTRRSQDVIRVATGEGYAAEPGGGRFTIAPERPADYRRLLAELRRQGRVPHAIVHLLAHGKPAAAGADDADAEVSSFFSLVHLAQALGDEPLAEPLALAIVVSGACEVLGNEPLAPGRALALGPCRVIPQELAKVSCRLLDVLAPSGRAANRKLARQVLGELSLMEHAGAADAVVAYRGTHRWTESFVAAPPAERQNGRPLPLRSGGVYLVTGGLGGIGGALAEHLAESAGAKLVLTSRRALPDRAEWQRRLAQPDSHDDAIAAAIRRVLAIEEKGGEALVLRADVSDRDEMRAALAVAQERFGALHGVIHAAGVPGGGILQYKTPEAARRVFAPKVAGTRVLAELLAGRELDFFAVCSSLAAVLGGLGQADYVAANAFQDCFARSAARSTGWPVVAIGWDTWSEVGMAVDMTRQGGSAAAAEPSFRPVDHPLLDRCVLESGEWVVYDKTFRPEHDWVLREHRIQGQSLLPGTAYLELACAAFSGHHATPGCELSEVALIAPFLAPAAGGRELRVSLNRAPDGHRFSMSSREGGTDAAWTEHTRGLLRELRAKAGPPLDLGAIGRRCSLQEILIDDQTPQRHGPHWRCVRRIRLGEDEMLAELELPPDLAGETERYTLHPSLMDAATSFFIRNLPGVDYLPVGYSRLEVFAALPPRLVSHVKTPVGQRYGSEVLNYDVTLADPAGAVLAEVRGYTLKRIAQAAARLQAPAAAASAPAPETPAPAPPRPARLLADRLELGLRTPEGIAVFDRILGQAYLGHVLVSTEDLALARERARTTTLGKILASSEHLLPQHARPEVRSEYLAPRTEIERTLAGIWAELLGIDRVGVNDNFFELGGHSLLGIQMVSRLRSALQVEISVGTIFDHPTIAGLAEAIPGLQAAGGAALQEIRREDRNELGELAMRVDELSESEVDALLAEMISERETVEGGEAAL